MKAEGQSGHQKRRGTNMTRSHLDGLKAVHRAHEKKNDLVENWGEESLPYFRRNKKGDAGKGKRKTVLFLLSSLFTHFEERRRKHKRDQLNKAKLIERKEGPQKKKKGGYRARVSQNERARRHRRHATTTTEGGGFDYDAQQECSYLFSQTIRKKNRGSVSAMLSIKGEAIKRSSWPSQGEYVKVIERAQVTRRPDNGNESESPAVGKSGRKKKGRNLEEEDDLMQASHYVKCERGVEHAERPITQQLKAKKVRRQYTRTHNSG